MLDFNQEKSAGAGYSSNELRLKKNIFLTGFMGSGKTSVGKVLADLLKINFFDSDELVIRKKQMSINEIFRRYGEDYFRDKETETLRILGDKIPGTCVISTGGGAVLRQENISAMKKNGIIVYLDVSAREAYRRIKDKDDRPLLNAGNPCKVIRDLLQERKPFYLKSDLAVNTAGKTIGEIAIEIINIVLAQAEQ